MEQGLSETFYGEVQQRQINVKEPIGKAEKGSQQQMLFLQDNVECRENEQMVS